jgi:hypothetical protein
MELDPIIEVHDSLSHIKDTITAWNPDEVEDNPNTRSICKDVHRTCCTVMEIIDGFVSVSDSENSSGSDSQVCSLLLEYKCMCSSKFMAFRENTKCRQRGCLESLMIMPVQSWSM